MARIDIQTLVLAFEKRIEALEKNPPDKVPTSVILNLLDNAIGEVIKKHFVDLIELEMKEMIKDEFYTHKDEFIEKALINIFDNEEFRTIVEKEFKNKILKSIRG